MRLLFILPHHHFLQRCGLVRSGSPSAAEEGAQGGLPLEGPGGDQEEPAALRGSAAVGRSPEAAPAAHPRASRRRRGRPAGPAAAAPVRGGGGGRGGRRRLPHRAVRPRRGKTPWKKVYLSGDGFMPETESLDLGWMGMHSIALYGARPDIRWQKSHT